MLKRIIAQIQKRVPVVIETYWARLDPKLKYTIISGGVTYALGATAFDGPSGAVLAGVVASLVGYNVTNDGSTLRQLEKSEGGGGGFDSGNPSGIHGKNNSAPLPLSQVEQTDIDRSELDPTDERFEDPSLKAAEEEGDELMREDV